MTGCVVDTNVAIAANGRAACPQASPECVKACVGALLEVLSDRRRLVLDDRWRLIAEYRHKLSASGQPGIGDRFLKWVLTNYANPARCERVAVHEAGSGEEFEELPPEVSNIADPSDRKFLAVAAAHPDRPPILEGVDSKWWGWKETLASHGLTVEFLCQKEQEETFARKFPGSASGKPSQ
ncbi:MAG TPA: hypothetical protein PLL76_16285 [Thermoanaerobaculia bacterium]|nr:hypothetical protein [Thermoanaerobaculia bacterium]